MGILRLSAWIAPDLFRGRSSHRLPVGSGNTSVRLVLLLQPHQRATSQTRFSPGNDRGFFARTSEIFQRRLSSPVRRPPMGSQIPTKEEMIVDMVVPDQPFLIQNVPSGFQRGPPFRKGEELHSSYSDQHTIPPLFDLKTSATEEIPCLQILQHCREISGGSVIRPILCSRHSPSSRTRRTDV